MREERTVISFLKRLMRRRNRLPCQLATDIGVSHTTVIRWLSGKDVPSTSSCRRLAEYSGVSLQRILAFAGHLPEVIDDGSSTWPEFREYARQKYPGELDEDLVTMIEDLIERRRQRNSEKKNPKVGM